MNLTEFAPILDPAEFDYFRATIKEIHWQQVKELILDFYPKSEGKEARGLYGYEKGLDILVDGDKALTIFKEGNAGTVCLQASGRHSRTCRELLVSSGVEFKPSRMDACLDYDEEGLADSLFDYGLHFATERDLKIEQYGNWHHKRARTLQIGSRASNVMIRIYEKGHKAIDSDGDLEASPHWVRIEVEIKPDKKRKAYFALMEASDLFKCGWASDFIGGLFCQDMAMHPVGYRRVQTTDKKQKRWLVKSGRNIMLKWIEEFETPEQWGRRMYELALKSELHPEDL